MIDECWSCGSRRVRLRGEGVNGERRHVVVHDAIMFSAFRVGDPGATRDPRKAAMAVLDQSSKR
eukprot:5860519-Heterocapsa_arctica.AAC.1